MTDIHRHQAQSDIVELLEGARARTEQSEYAKWSSGSYTYALRLDVPVSVFASVEPKLQEIEKSIS